MKVVLSYGAEYIDIDGRFVTEDVGEVDHVRRDNAKSSGTHFVHFIADCETQPTLGNVG